MKDLLLEIKDRVSNWSLMNVSEMKAALSDVEDEICVALDSLESDSESFDLIELYRWCECEWGKPIVIHPKGYRSNDGNINVGESLLDCYWAIIESNGCRTINFLISATKSISEGEGPAFYDCPLYFFELVPEVNAHWRECVRAYWKEEGDM